MRRNGTLAAAESGVLFLFATRTHGTKRGAAYATSYLPRASFQSPATRSVFRDQSSIAASASRVCRGRGRLWLGRTIGRHSEDRTCPRLGELFEVEQWRTYLATEGNMAVRVAEQFGGSRTLGVQLALQHSGIQKKGIFPNVNANAMHDPKRCNALSIPLMQQLRSSNPPTCQLYTKPKATCKMQYQLPPMRLKHI